MSKHVLVYIDIDQGVGPHAFRQLFTSFQVELASSLFTLKAIDHQFLF